MKKAVIFFVLLFTYQLSVAQADINKYEAMFTLNFIRYIGWADEAKQGDFIIGVVKKSEIAELLKNQSAGKKFGFQSIVVKEFNSIEEVTDCQIIFLGSSSGFKKNFELLLQKMNKKNTLIIAESEGSTKFGAVINFVIREGVLKFEISPANAEAMGLQLSNSLTSMTSAIIK